MSEPAPARRAVTMRKFAPAFPVSDLVASLAHYARLGFTTSEYTGASAAGGQCEGVMIDPDGNIIRFGSPL